MWQNFRQLINCKLFNALLILYLLINCACIQGCHPFAARTFFYMIQEVYRKWLNQEVHSIYSVQQNLRQPQKAAN